MLRIGLAVTLIALLGAAILYFLRDRNEPEGGESSSSSRAGASSAADPRRNRGNRSADVDRTGAPSTLPSTPVRSHDGPGPNVPLRFRLLDDQENPSSDSRSESIAATTRGRKGSSKPKRAAWTVASKSPRPSRRNGRRTPERN